MSEENHSPLNEVEQSRYGSKVLDQLLTGGGEQLGIEQKDYKKVCKIATENAFKANVNGDDVCYFMNPLKNSEIQTNDDGSFLDEIAAIGNVLKDKAPELFTNDKGMKSLETDMTAAAASGDMTLYKTLKARRSAIKSGNYGKKLDVDAFNKYGDASTPIDERMAMAAAANDMYEYKRLRTIKKQAS